MNNKTLKSVVIDAGHGGNDPGASANDIIEKDYTLKISKYINERLNELGINSSLSRDSDITLNPSERPEIIQSFYGNGSDVVVVSNHLNAGGGDGAEIIYALRNNEELSKKIAKELENVGQNVRKYYQRRLPSNPQKDYYYIHRLTPNNETIIVEYGFVDSKGDDISIIKNGWQTLAEAVVKAIVDYIGGVYIAPNLSNYYTVKSGETLWSIAKKFNTTVEELKKINNLQSNLLSIGQNILIKQDVSKPSTVIKYTVKKGDTLYSIAKKFDININRLKEINNLNTNDLSINQELIVSENEQKELDNQTYTVQKGDTLWSISQKFNTNVDNLKSFNNIETDSLSIGQIINIPPKEAYSSKYIVKKGDTLYSIAKYFDVSIDELKKENNLDNEILSIDQELIIPKKEEYTTYTVQKGDTLYSIARNNNTTISQIIELNNLETSDLNIGQKLLLP